MAPELLNDDEMVAKPSRASDVWAFGCLVLEVQSGLPPYCTKRNDLQVIISLSKGELPHRPPLMPDSLWNFVLECCCTCPALRLTTRLAMSRLKLQRVPKVAKSSATRSRCLSM
ncbi:hypothetical protein EXIGLDRAFT_718513 [Exidia glandulosa HHB12029]|uniref:Protein kinase domain-containing protein n=1 Tax=Exidia glandulosa HHB12029 TaxID=1314781 RepID=A0A165NYF0_EXIGL|nr:hypothetical protein EXIGLDRAFT_718513 [Exidia glandulosa HHB12029]